MKWTPDTARAYGRLGEQAHVAVLKPLLRQMLGELEGQTALDFGCGPGELTMALGELGAERVIGIDQSPQMVQQAIAAASLGPAARREVFEFIIGDDSLLPMPSRFDAVLSSLALMMCEDMPRLQAAMAGLIHSLNPRGRMLLILTHPCFRETRYATFHYDLPKDYTYWASGTPYQVILGDREQGTVIYDYHWTLEDYVDAISTAGGAVRQLREVPALRQEDGSPQGPPAYVAMLVRRM